MGATNLTFSATQLIAIVIVSPGRFDGFVRALPGVLMAITTYEGRAGICMHAQLVVVFRGRAARAGQPDLDEVRDVFFFSNSADRVYTYPFITTGIAGGFAES
jgi:hypothetical protein